MMSYQKGDGRIVLGGQVFGLRLTMGALAEISDKLSISGPAGLASCLRKMNPTYCKILLSSMITAGGQVAPNELSQCEFSKPEMAAALPEVCRLFEEAFCDPAA